MPDAEKIIDTAIQEWDQIALRTSPSTPLATHIVRALREAGMLTEPGWEYGAGYQADNGIEMRWFSMGSGAFAIREAAEREVERFSDAQIRLVRRRKPGPWEPVEGDPR